LFPAFGKKRPSLNEIDAVLRGELAPHFAELESYRRQVILRITATGVLTLFFLLFLFSLTRQRASAAPVPLNLFLVLTALAWAPLFYFVHRSRKRYTEAFKETVMTKIAARFFPELQYQPEHFISQSLYEESALFHKNLSLYTGNDLFQGKLGDVHFRFSELLCQYTTGSGKSRTTHTAFRGFFFVGDFQRDFYFRTTVQPDVAEHFLGVMGRGLQRLESGTRLVDLEDPEFERLFVVTSDDQVEARYILTPAFMEQLKDFRQRVGHDIHLCFVNGKMILAIEADHDYFEPHLMGEVLSRRDLMGFIDMLSLLIGVAKEFLQHPTFAGAAPAMPHPPLPPKAVPPPLTAAQLAWVRKK
jgi:hypothetical protein